jgi:hypothetical protein
MSGVAVTARTAAEGGNTVGSINNGDWIAFTPYRINNVTSFTARVSSTVTGGTLQIRTGSATGTIVGSAAVPSTGSTNTFTNITGTITNPPTGTTTLYLTFAGGTGTLFEVDAFTLNTGTGSGGTGRITGLGGKCLDVRGASSADGTQVQIFTCNNTAAQTWTRTGQTLRALGKCLDVSGASTANGAKIQLWTCNGTGAQNWVPQANGTLMNTNSNKCLDVLGSSTADSTIVQLFTCSGAANQQWILP